MGGLTAWSFAAVCIRESPPGTYHLYNSEEDKNLKYDGPVKNGKLGVGDWVTVEQKDDSIHSVSKTESLLPTRVRDFHLEVELNDAVLLPREREKKLRQGRSNSLGEKIAVPLEMCLKGFKLGIPCTKWITPMDTQEANRMWQLTGDRMRWKFVVEENNKRELEDSIKNQHANGKISSGSVKRRTQKVPRPEGLVKRKGIIVSRCSEALSACFLWTPEAPPQYDGILKVDESKEPVAMGDWVDFWISEDQAARVYGQKHSRERFEVVDYEKTTPEFETWVAENPGHEPVVEMLVPLKLSKNSRKMQGKILFLFHEDMKIIADPLSKTNKYFDSDSERLVDLKIRKVNPRNEREVPWIVIGVELSPDSGSGEDRTTRTYLTRTIRVAGSTTSSSSAGRSTSPTAARGMARISLDNGIRDDSALVVTSNSENTDNLRAFVEAESVREQFIWIIDSPQQSILKLKRDDDRRVAIGGFIRGYFKRNADGRLECLTEKFTQCEGPVDCRVFERKRKAVVQTEIVYNYKTGKAYSKYLGDVVDINGLLKREGSSCDVFWVRVSKMKLEDGSFHWSIERIESKLLEPIIAY